MHKKSAMAVMGVIIFGGALPTPGFAQQPGAAPPLESSPLSPPVNHESGFIDDVLTAADGSYRLRGYIVRWRDSRVYVTGSPDEVLQKGAVLSFTVYRSVVAGEGMLRFATNAVESDGAELAQQEAADSQASLTYGTAPVENVVSAENGGYRFAAYTVTWHDARVMVVDPSPHSPHAVGDRIRFRVMRTGADEKRRLGFVLIDK